MSWPVYDTWIIDFCRLTIHVDVLHRAKPPSQIFQVYFRISLFMRNKCKIYPEKGSIDRHVLSFINNGQWPLNHLSLLDKHRSVLFKSRYVIHTHIMNMRILFTTSGFKAGILICVHVVEPKFLDFNIQNQFLRQKFTLLLRNWVFTTAYSVLNASTKISNLLRKFLLIRKVWSVHLQWDLMSVGAEFVKLSKLHFNLQ